MSNHSLNYIGIISIGFTINSGVEKPRDEQLGGDCSICPAKQMPVVDEIRIQRTTFLQKNRLTIVGMFT